VVAIETEFVVDFRKGAKLQTGDVGEDGSAANGDSIFDNEFGERAEEVVYLAGRFEVKGIRPEMPGQIGSEVRLQLGLNVAEAVARVGQGGKAATAARVIDVAACGAGESGAWLRFHFGPLEGRDRGYTPGVFAKSVEVVWNEGIAKGEKSRVWNLQILLGLREGEWRRGDEERRSQSKIARVLYCVNSIMK
jgi:hypothetical protein